MGRSANRILAILQIAGIGLVWLLAVVPAAAFAGAAGLILLVRARMAGRRNRPSPVDCASPPGLVKLNLGQLHSER